MKLLTLQFRHTQSSARIWASDFSRFTGDQAARPLEHVFLQSLPGIKIGQQIKLTVNNVHANSLYSVIADGKYRATPLGRNAWKTLIGFQASMLFAALSLAEQKLVPLRTTKMLAAAVTLEFSFLQLDMVMVMVMIYIAHFLCKYIQMRFTST